MSWSNVPSPVEPDRAWGPLGGDTGNTAQMQRDLRTVGIGAPRVGLGLVS